MPVAHETVRSARTIDVQIPVVGWRGNQRTQTGVVTPEPIPTRRAALAPFVGALFPGQTIEHLGRPDILDLDKYAGRLGPRVEPHSLFFQAVHEAFNQHLPLALRPEVLAYLIAHEIAVVVNAHPEDYRDLFTTSREKVTLTVRDDSLERGNPASDWGRTIGLFEGRFREFVPGDLVRNMVPGFSTETPESRAATLVAFMDAAQSFYDYRVSTLCGLPRIRLDGIPEDYERLVLSAQAFARAFGKHLGEYFAHLIPVLEKIAYQAVGEPADNEFWKRLYQFHDGSGTPTFSGWITAFLAHTRKTDGSLVPKDARLFDWASIREYSGIPIGAVATHVSSAPFQWDYLGREYPMRFIGGVLGIEDSDGFVCPRLSYGVLNAAQ